MKHLLILLLIGLNGSFFFHHEAKAQSQISGKVHSVQSTPVANISVLLLSANDSALVKGTTTNSSGGFLLDKILEGNFLLLCSGAGYTSHYSVLRISSRVVNLPIIILTKDTLALKTVTVSAKKPLFEQKIDRFIINIKNSITNAGGTVLEVLEKSPGVMVNRSSGAVSLNGKDGVMVMINGKMNYMPQEAVLQMLNGISATSVDRIELITTPPAKYDAGGNAGYINIVMADNPNEGFNGNYSLSMGVGNGTEPKAGVNFNYRKKNLNLYGAYNYTRLAQLQTFESYRKVNNQGGEDEISIISNRDPYQENHGARLGIDYKLSKKTVLGALISGYDNNWVMKAVNYSDAIHNNVPDTNINIVNNEINRWKNAMANLNLSHTINEGTEFTINTDYLYYNNKNPTDYLNTYYKSANNLFTENTTSGKKTVIKIWVSQFDFSKKMDEQTNLQLGVKASFSRFTNDVLVQKLVGSTWWADPDFTANYFLKEDIMAAYISANRKVNAKTNLKAGLRYEYTRSNLGSETQKNIVDRKYGKLFPSLFISHQLNDKHSLNFSYSRRINRPAFTQLAPFLIFLDPKTFISGNSSLQPSITDAVKVDLLIKKIVFSANYSYEKNTIARFQTEVNTSNNTQTTTPQNMKHSQLFYCSATLPAKITAWWFSQVSLGVNWNKIEALYKKEPVGFSQIYYTASGSESFTLPKKYSVELSGFYQSKAFAFGASKLNALGKLDFALQKKFNNNSSLTFGIDNVLNSMKIKTSFSIPKENFETTGSFIFFFRMYKITWNHNFGNKILKEKRARTTASEDERKRVE
ncbi:MAG: TonB-dependent receptor [Ferruginibacter sp.]|nr:TonB-dependent receptor [Ferruginibacter sp.]